LAWQLVCDLVDDMGPLIDCGVVTPADDDAAWQAAQQCALEAVAMTAALCQVGWGPVPALRRGWRSDPAL